MGMKRIISLFLVIVMVLGLLSITAVAALIPFQTIRISGERSQQQFGRVDLGNPDARNAIFQSLPFNPTLEGARIEFSVQQTQFYNISLYRMPADTFERR